ncbi:MAG: TolC family protein [Myxococcota bacterium]
MLTLLLSLPARALTLDQAWAAATDHDLQLALARERSIQADTMRGKAWSALQPRLDVGAQYVINNTEIALDFSSMIPEEFAAIVYPDGPPPPTIVQEKAFWQGDVTLSQRLVSGPAIPLLRAAYGFSAAGRDDLRAAEVESKTRVAAAFYGQLTAERAMAVAEQGVALAQSQLALAQRQSEAGLIDERAMVQARLGLSRAERDLRTAQEGVTSARTGFELAAGIPGTDLELPEPMAVPTGLDAALIQARERRPDLQAAARRAEAMHHQRLAQDLRWLPAIDGVATYSYTQNPGFNDQNWNWRIVLAASWNLWDGGLRFAESRETASQVRAAEFGRELLEDSIVREITVAFESYARAQSGLVSVENERALAAQSLELAETSYAAGGASFLEVEQARLMVQATELSALRERMARDLAAIELLARTGSL